MASCNTRKPIGLRVLMAEHSKNTRLNFSWVANSLITTATSYLLDANVFIRAANEYYALDLVPRFWDNLDRFAALGRVISIDRVQGELLAPPALVTWIQGSFIGGFKSTTDTAVATQYARVMQWVQNGNPTRPFTPAAIAQFAGVADGWLIAYALAFNCLVVTLETYEPNCYKKVKIPNVCRAFGIVPIDTFEMMRRLGIRLT